MLNFDHFWRENSNSMYHNHNKKSFNFGNFVISLKIEFLDTIGDFLTVWHQQVFNNGTYQH